MKNKNDVLYCFMEVGAAAAERAQSFGVADGHPFACQICRFVLSVEHSPRGGSETPNQIAEDASDTRFKPEDWSEKDYVSFLKSVLGVMAQRSECLRRLRLGERLRDCIDGRLIG